MMISNNMPTLSGVYYLETAVNGQFISQDGDVFSLDNWEVEDRANDSRVRVFYQKLPGASAAFSNMFMAVSHLCGKRFGWASIEWEMSSYSFQPMLEGKPPKIIIKCRKASPVVEEIDKKIHNDVQSLNFPVHGSGFWESSFKEGAKVLAAMRASVLEKIRKSIEEGIKKQVREFLERTKQQRLQQAWEEYLNPIDFPLDEPIPYSLYPSVEQYSTLKSCLLDPDLLTPEKQEELRQEWFRIWSGIKGQFVVLPKE